MWFPMLRCRSALFGLLVSAAFVSTISAADEPSTADLPVTRVVLFNAGVGFFEHTGSVEETQQVVLKFNTDQINDLLQSLVLQDLGGGQVSAVTYEAREPLARTLKTFAIDLTRAATLADLLQQVRGQQIAVEAPQPIEGILLGVETRKVAAKDTVVDQQFLNLKTSGGLRSIAMDSIVNFRLLDQKLNAELDEALSLLAAAHSTDNKSVTLQFRGKGKRNVRVGYIQEAPVWKASYRLVLGDEKPPFLQGWAIVENTGEHDWKDVNLSLVSGRPISFIMELYEPLFVQRPTVVPQEFADLKPRVHGQDLSKEAKDATLQPNAIRAKDKKGRGMMGGIGGDGSFGYARAPQAPAPMEDQAAVPFNPAEGIATAAAAGDVGELFRYEIKSPVTLAHHKSAMLPIVNESIEGKKLSIYNQSVQPKYPYNGFRLKNTTDLHWLQGPVTVFDGGEFAGDAQIEDVPPAATRLISYALDLDVEVAPEAKSRPDELAAVSIAKGTLKLTRKLTRQHQYTIKNSGQNKKTVLIEQPIEAGWQLVSPKEPAEKTRNLYRFEVAVEPGQSTSLNVVEQQQVSEQIMVGTLGNEAILAFATNAAKLNPAVEQALQQCVALKSALDAAIAEVSRVQVQINTIVEDQARIRQNLPQLDRTNTLYNRYVKKLSEQEDELEQLHKQLTMLNDRATKARAALDEFLLGLTIE
ncbi:MAG: hypothetical protein IT427_10210 [Pirellulales bacterium]|nr:hypothetical protein [Pirellulales bacterium]